MSKVHKLHVDRFLFDWLYFRPFIYFYWASIYRGVHLYFSLVIVDYGFFCVIYLFLSDYFWYLGKMVGPTPTIESSSWTKTDPANDDDPLYIHPSDYTITAIVNFKLTRMESFHFWHSFVTKCLKGRNKLEFWMVMLKIVMTMNLDH